MLSPQTIDRVYYVLLSTAIISAGLTLFGLLLVAAGSGGGSGIRRLPIDSTMGVYYLDWSRVDAIEWIRRDAASRPADSR